MQVSNPLKKIIFSAIFLFSLFFSHAQKGDKKLEEKIAALIQGFNGNIGVYVKSLKNGKTVSINGDTIFPTASIVKVPILIGIMNRIQKKRIGLSSEVGLVRYIELRSGRRHCCLPQTTNRN